MNVLGISAFFHDSAAALVRDGEVVAAAEEERYTRRKHEYRFPTRATEFCLRKAGLTIDQVDHVVYYEKPGRRVRRVLATLLANPASGRREYVGQMLTYVRRLARLRSEVRREIGFRGRVLFTEHHVAHAASAFYCSPFEDAAVFTIDGVGEWATAATGTAGPAGIALTREMHFPHSLGLLYSVFTGYLGFRPNSGEYKVMGLAPYGKPRFLDRLLEIAPIAADGSLRLDLRYFRFEAGLPEANERFWDHFGGPPRESETGAFTDRENDLAASVQAYTELAMIRTCHTLAAETGQRRLVMAGGVALNCTANSKLLRETPFREIFVQPGAGDSGCALGAALAVYHQLTGQPNSRRRFSPYLGDDFTEVEVEEVLRKHRAKYRRLTEDELCREVAAKVAAGRVVGWCQGRMEFGPRALGGRSILADPRSPTMKEHLNEAIKLREGFRPFAPSVMKEQASDLFDLPQADCDYMLFVANVRPGVMAIPAVTHVDGTARVQTVSRDGNPLYHRLLTAFRDLTGCPVLVNTSFNVRGEPIVRTPFEAYRCFMATGIDDLAVGPCLLAKEDQKVDPAINYLDDLELD